MSPQVLKYLYYLNVVNQSHCKPSQKLSKEVSVLKICRCPKTALKMPKCQPHEHDNKTVGNMGRHHSHWLGDACGDKSLVTARSGPSPSGQGGGAKRRSCKTGDPGPNGSISAEQLATTVLMGQALLICCVVCMCL